MYFRVKYVYFGRIIELLSYYIVSKCHNTTVYTILLSRYSSIFDTSACSNSADDVRIVRMCIMWGWMLQYGDTYSSLFDRSHVRYVGWCIVQVVLCMHDGASDT